MNSSRPLPAMVVRITKTEGANPCVLKIDGLLEAAAVKIWHREWATASRPTSLDLRGLRSADASDVLANRAIR